MLLTVSFQGRTRGTNVETEGFNNDIIVIVHFVFLFLATLSSFVACPNRTEFDFVVERTSSSGIAHGVDSVLLMKVDERKLLWKKDNCSSRNQRLTTMTQAIAIYFGHAPQFAHCRTSTKAIRDLIPLAWEREDDMVPLILDSWFYRFCATIHLQDVGANKQKRGCLLVFAKTIRIYFSG